MKNNKTMYFTGKCEYPKCGATIFGHIDPSTDLLCKDHELKKEKKSV